MAGYLPKDWAADPVRRKTAGVPETQAFATKPEIALTQVRQAVAAGVPMGVVLADAGYGDETAFRDGLTELGMLYAVGIRPATTVWAPGTGPLQPKPWSGRGIRPTRLRRQPGNEPLAVKGGENRMNTSPGSRRVRGISMGSSVWWWVPPIRQKSSGCAQWRRPCRC